jgi:general secretion pathway protein L
LLPGVDVVIKKVPINGSFNRQMQQALPYLVEEELACDVEQLHFHIIAKETELVHVAICEKQKMHTWLEWLAEANIICNQFIPEGLTLPLPENEIWQGVQLDQQWLIRESQYMAWSCDASMLEEILLTKTTEDNVPSIDSYSPFSETSVANWSINQHKLPIELLTLGAINNKINLLSAEFKSKKNPNKYFLQWRFPILLVTILLFVLMLNLYLQNRQIEAKTNIVKQQVEEVYQQAFPEQNKLKYARINKRLKTMLMELNDGKNKTEFLTMLNELIPSIKDNNKFKVTNIKFDRRKNELHIVATAQSFEAFEAFKNKLPKKLSVEQGALNNNKNGVSGTLTIRGK